jgi:hypothetical protein
LIEVTKGNPFHLVFLKMMIRAAKEAFASERKEAES